MFRSSPFDKCRPLSLLAGLIASTVLLVGCGGSVSANAGAKASSDAGAEGDVNFDAEASGSGETSWETTDQSLSEDDTSAVGQLSTPQGTAMSHTAPLLGARRDIRLADGTSEVCKCLAVAVGDSNSSRFVWGGERPTINAQSQRVIALSSDGIICTESRTGASYMGYELKAGDVIVKVEAAVAGRPVTRGAIIPRPAEGKQIYVQPVGDIPYGKGPGGEPRCALGR